MADRNAIWALAFCAALAACAPSGSSTESPANETASFDQAAANTMENVSETAEPVVDEGMTNVLPAARPATPDASAGREGYSARGQEPGWLLTMAKGRIDYTGNYGEKHINVPLPIPAKTAEGEKFETSRLTVEIAPGRCNDAMSGQGFSDKVTIAADGETYQGCGGERKPAWDM